MTLRITILLSFALAAPISAANISGIYEVPVSNPALIEHATHTIDIKKFSVDRRTRETILQLSLPEYLMGSPTYVSEFRGMYRDNETFILKLNVDPSGYSNASPNDAMTCTIAKSQSSILCLSKWHGIDKSFNEEWLRNRYAEQRPELGEAIINQKIAVAKIFSGDGIGILRFKLQLTQQEQGN